jgi:hypothetical protein
LTGSVAALNQASDESLSVGQLSGRCERVEGTILLRFSISDFFKQDCFTVLGSFYRVVLCGTSWRFSYRQVQNYNHQHRTYCDGFGRVPVRSDCVGSLFDMCSSVSTSRVFRDACALSLICSSSSTLEVSAALTSGNSCVPTIGTSIGGIITGVSTR